MKLTQLIINGETVAPAGRRRAVWDGFLDCSHDNLTSLEGAPKKVTGFFTCYNNKKLTSLLGGPVHVGGNFDCRDTNVTSLEGAPAHVGGDFDCGHTNVTSLKGAPAHVWGNFYCFHNEKLTSLHDVHKQLKEINGTLFLKGTKVTSHLLGLLLVKGLQKVSSNHPAFKVINRYLPNREGMKGVLRCQRELIEAGLEKEAQL